MMLRHPEWVESGSLQKLKYRLIKWGLVLLHLPPCDQGRLPQLQQPILWWAQFPKHIQKELVSFSNPRGRITNSDLELAGSIAHNDVLAQLVDVTEATTASGTDNTLTLAWRHKGSTTTSKAAAYLLRCLALHHRHYRYLRRDFFIPGI
eukprot:scaffold327180_cov28-Attheya_sp.AAC.1